MKATNPKYNTFLNSVALNRNLLANDAAIFKCAEEGVAIRLFYTFAEAISISQMELATLLNLPAGMLSNQKQTIKSLIPSQGEHLLRLIALYGKGIELFGSIHEFKYWLNKPFWNADKKPGDWLINAGGINLAMKELDQLGYGYPV
jgi:uncharacterized protein (DUF2384 family)